VCVCVCVCVLSPACGGSAAEAADTTSTRNTKGLIVMSLCVCVSLFYVTVAFVRTCWHARACVCLLTQEELRDRNMVAVKDQSRQGWSKRLVHVLLNQQSVLQLRDRGP
jgi:hypothetical protein